MKDFQLWLPMILPPNQSAIGKMNDGFDNLCKELEIPNEKDVTLYKRFYRCGFIKGHQAGRASK